MVNKVRGVYCRPVVQEIVPNFFQTVPDGLTNVAMPEVKHYRVVLNNYPLASEILHPEVFLKHYRASQHNAALIAR